MPWHTEVAGLTLRAHHRIAQPSTGTCTRTACMDCLACNAAPCSALPELGGPMWAVTTLFSSRAAGYQDAGCVRSVRSAWCTRLAMHLPAQLTLSLAGSWPAGQTSPDAWIWGHCSPGSPLQPLQHAPAMNACCTGNQRSSASEAFHPQQGHSLFSLPRPCPSGHRPQIPVLYQAEHSRVPSGSSSGLFPKRRRGLDLWMSPSMHAQLQTSADAHQ